MSDDQDEEQKSLTLADHARRRFLERIVLAAAGTSAAAILPPIAASATPDAPKASSAGMCPEVKIPMQDVEGKVVFITGGSSGIGLGIARAFTDAGMKVVIGYRTQSHLEEAMKYLAKAGDRVHAIKVDVVDRPGMEQAAAETVKVFGKVHVLVNNAGVHIPGTLSATSHEDWSWLMDVNMNGVLNGVQAFLPLIQGHGEGGQVITTSSVLGLFVWGLDQAAYVASKFAVVGMMESLRMELTGTNIGVSILCPGWVSTNLGRSSRNRPPGDAAPAASPQDPAELKEKKQVLVESGLFMDPLDVGQIALRGMRNNDLYILTHPEWEQMMQFRHELLMASTARDLRLNDERLSTARTMTENSIYAAERRRRSCARRGRS